MNVYTATKGLVNRGRKGVLRRIQGGWARLSAKLSCARGQGTTEYAILVGVPTKQDNVLMNPQYMRVKWGLLNRQGLYYNIVLVGLSKRK